MFAPFARPSIAFLGITALSTFLGACAEDHDCPDGYRKTGALCRRLDAGSPLGDASTDPILTDAARSETDLQSRDAFVGSVERDAQQLDAQQRDAQSEDATSSLDATYFPDGAGDAAPAPQCGTGLAQCGLGYFCTSGRCESECTRMKCDAHATCALRNGSAQCSCDSGFLPVPNGTLTTCVADVECSQLGCDQNGGTCVQDQNKVRSCACKAGYTGTGKSCTAVSCRMLTVENGSVSPAGSVTFNNTARYACNTGYQLKLQGALVAAVERRCDEMENWTGIAPTCEPVPCKPLTKPEHGSINYSNGSVYQSKAEYSCASGYHLSNEADRVRTCQSNGSWTGSDPSCLGCGDGVVSKQIGEECDPAAMNSSVWTCDAKSCKKRSIYAPCYSDVDCVGVGELCYNNSCTTSCLSGEACVATPSGSVPSGQCAGPVCLATGCGSTADCAPGLVCIANGSKKICVACSDVAPCPSGFQCQGARCVRR